MVEDEPSIAVLPFLNLSADKDNEYFSDGLAEELLTALARIPELRVTGRTSSAQFKGRTEDVRLTAKAFGVLRYLVAPAGQLVPKDELCAAVWT